MALLKIKRKDEKKVESVDTYTALPLAKDEIGLSDKAAGRIRELATDTKTFLRVAIKGGGCSGLSLYFELGQELKANDQVFSKGDAQVVIDKKSLSILGGATVHCREYLGSKEFFLLNNPAEKQCSCGKSFAL